MNVTRARLLACGIREEETDRYLKELRRQLADNNINTPLRLAHFMVQVIHESANLRRIRENLDYSAEGLRKHFPHYFTIAQARDYAGQAERIANRIYADRMGNGPEASGDGWRFRGRGLIQVTGRDNYSVLAKWLDVDVEAKPDLVAQDFPVACAVWFWVRHDLNRYADNDDLTRITRTVHGSDNTVARREAILARTKTAFRVADIATVDSPTHEVAASALNLRDRPRVTRTSRIATLPQGAGVEALGVPDSEGWLKVRTVVDGRLLAGYVASAYLTPFDGDDRNFLRVESRQPLPEAHLSEGNPVVRRQRGGGRAHPLGEADMPRREASTPEQRAEQLVQIVNWLAPAKTQHLRYQPNSQATYCNILAHDYCYLAGAYLPRVWWTPSALRSIERGQTVRPAYDRTVREIRANGLHDWFGDYGSVFGWRREVSLDLLQAAANHGEVCAIVAKHVNEGVSGHITVVVPENGKHLALRSARGEVTHPLQSQAGRKNATWFAGPRTWWTASRFSSFAFWRLS